MTDVVMRVVAVRPTDENDPRAALTPDAVKRLIDLGFAVTVEAGIGVAFGAPDQHYQNAGAAVAGDRKAALHAADLLAAVAPLPEKERGLLKAGSLYVGFVEPLLDPAIKQSFADQKVDVVAMEMVPRTSYAQKMDALSSQASLAGYQATIEAAHKLGKALPMMTTAAGTIRPARVFVLGAGVAGLQAIATARRLGAQVSGFDTRAAAMEQIASLGAKPVVLDLGPAEETKHGYAKGLTDDQIAEQRRQIAKIAAESDIVITAAQVFGRKAPILLTKEMVAGMEPGSVVVDLAAATGGNVDGVVPDAEIFTDNGVLILGHRQFSGRVAGDASRMYASNLTHLLDHMWDKEAKRLQLDPNEDEIVDNVLVAKDGVVRESGSAAKAKAAEAEKGAA